MARIVNEFVSNLSIERLQVFAHFVADLTTLSKCKDKQTAAIITDARGTQVYSIGINGGPRGGVQCLCGTGRYTCVHAEQNAIGKCHSDDRHKIMICSYSPCVTCAALIVNNDFDEVYYLEKYHNEAGIQILQRAGIKTFYIPEVI